MRPETRKKLDAIQTKGRLFGWSVLAVGVVGILLFWFYWAPAVGERRVNAIVLVSRFSVDTDTGRQTLIMAAQLQDGKRVRATSLWLVPPANQSTIVLRERVSMIGYRSYSWEGPSRN